MQIKTLAPKKRFSPFTKESVQSHFAVRNIVDKWKTFKTVPSFPRMFVHCLEKLGKKNLSATSQASANVSDFIKVQLEKDETSMTLLEGLQSFIRKDHNFWNFEQTDRCLTDEHNGGGVMV